MVSVSSSSAASQARQRGDADVHRMILGPDHPLWDKVEFRISMLMDKHFTNEEAIDRLAGAAGVALDGIGGSKEGL